MIDRTNSEGTTSGLREAIDGVRCSLEPPSDAVRAGKRQETRHLWIGEPLERSVGVIEARRAGGDDQQSGHLFSYLSPEERVPADHPLWAIRGVTDE